MNNDELWLMTKDSKTKKIKMHVKFDIENFIEAKFENVYSYVDYAINYAAKFIDDKHFSMLKKSMEYDLTGIKELQEEKNSNPYLLNNMLYSFENNLSEMIEYVNKTLDYAMVNLSDLYTMICGVLEARKILDNFPDEYHTTQQKLMIDIDISNIIKKFNNKIDWQVANITNQLWFLYWSSSSWFTLQRTINTHEYINEIKKLQIYHNEEVENNGYIED